jgi:CheY-like chemotaxis protein
MDVTILLVDDNRRFLDSTARFLDGAPGLTVVGRARSGAEALVVLDECRPDLVLLDLVMPGMDGFQTARRIKSRTGAPRVIFLSFYGSARDRAAANEIGDAFVAKADLVDTLIPTIARLFPAWRA